MFLVKDVLVEHPTIITEDEAIQYVEEELQLWVDKGRKLGKVILEVDEDEVIIHSIEKSPIKRVRRITGYLSEVNNFNDAKRAELNARTNHAS